MELSRCLHRGWSTLAWEASARQIGSEPGMWAVLHLLHRYRRKYSEGLLLGHGLSLYSMLSYALVGGYRDSPGGELIAVVNEPGSHSNVVVGRVQAVSCCDVATGTIIKTVCHSQCLCMHFACPAKLAANL